MERRIGESIMLEIRRDPAWLDDPEVNSYLNRLGNRLAAQSTESRQEFEFFALRDPTLNAFAMPGGYIGVHTGLILAAKLGIGTGLGAGPRNFPRHPAPPGAPPQQIGGGPGQPACWRWPWRSSRRAAAPTWPWARMAGQGAWRSRTS
jgi:hypothetical protein